MYKSILLFIAFSFIIDTSFAQYLYPEKFEGCEINSFLLDGGNPKAMPVQYYADRFIDNLNPSVLSKISGAIEVQILIDSLGKPCLMSAKNETNVKSKTLHLQYAINNTPNWIPAIDKGKKADVCVSLFFIFSNGNLSIRRRSFDTSKETNFMSVGTPQVKGTASSHLTETCTVYNQTNSEIPWDMSRAALTDKEGAQWFGTDNGLVRMKGDSINIFTQANSGLKPTLYNKNKTTTIMGAAVDKKNNKWFISGWDAYKYDNNSWTIYDSLNSPISWAYKIYIDSFNNVWFTSSRGLVKYNGVSWSVLNTTNSKIPSNNISGVFVDSKQRNWIGTRKGNVLIEDGKTTIIGNDFPPLIAGSINKMYESSNGDLWFYTYDEEKRKAGLFILNSQGEWNDLLTKKSDLFLQNSINDFLVDEEKNIVWIAVQNVGLLKYDLTTNTWEIYTTENSAMPSTNIMNLTLDKNGILWAATFAGVIKMNKK